MAEIIDDKSCHCIPFLLRHLKRHQEIWAEKPKRPPFFLGLNGVQGAGKTVLVTSMAQVLMQPPYHLPTAVLSIDDFYLPHEQQKQLAASHPSNPLIQHRGQPSTHDLPLALSVFSALHDKKECQIPSYEKSAYNGQGDRIPQNQWKSVNKEGEEAIEVVIFEGWCVGFRPLEMTELRRKWEAAVERKEQGEYLGRLGWNRFEDVEYVNEALRGYEPLTEQLNAIIHIDAEDLRFVYAWRLEQEARLRAVKGSGMTDEEVIKFVDGYYPAYELYTERLRAGMFAQEMGKHMRLVIGRDRKVKEVTIL